MSTKKLTDLITKQIAIEKDVEKDMAEQEKRVDTVAAKLLLLEVRLDAYKHAKILEAILNVVGEKPELLWNYRLESYVDSFAVKRELEKHMEREAYTLQQVEEEMKETKDEAVKLLLQHILEDEKKHHKIIETIIKKSYVLTS
jgi:rubrerythrin